MISEHPPEIFKSLGRRLCKQSCLRGVNEIFRKFVKDSMLFLAIHDVLEFLTNVMEGGRFLEYQTGWK